MRHDVEIRLLKQLEAHLDAGTTVDAGGLMKNPTSVYVDPELAEREWGKIFQGHPQIIGLSGDLPEAGSFMTVNDLGVPIATSVAVRCCRRRANAARNRTSGAPSTTGPTPLRGT